jgi:uncharacterized protein YfiM (DUF2279 family)
MRIADIPQDKAKHFAAGQVATLAGLPFGWQWGLALCVAAAFGREAWNVAHGGHWSWADIAATVLGAAPVLAGAGIGP